MCVVVCFGHNVFSQVFFLSCQARYLTDFPTGVCLRMSVRKSAQKILKENPQPMPKKSPANPPKLIQQVPDTCLHICQGHSCCVKGGHSPYQIWRFGGAEQAILKVEEFRCCQRTTARKTLATSHMGWGVGEELTKSWPTFEQLCVQNLALAISYCFLLPKARTKSGWLEVDQELDNGWPTSDTNISVLKLQGLSCSSPLATPKEYK